MKLSTRVIIAAGVLLAVIIGGLLIITYFHFPWLWPAEKWPDFWVATVSGVITLATIGAIATFVVERILKDLEEQRLEKQFRADCEREWAEFKQLLFYRLIEELPFSGDIDYATMATPHDATVLASLLETMPLSQWDRGLSLSSLLLFTYIQGFASRYSLFKIQANSLAETLRSNIDQYNRKWVLSGHMLDAGVSEDAQRAFCLGLLLKDYDLEEQFSTGTKEGSPEAHAGKELYKILKEDRLPLENPLKEAAKDMLWYLRLPGSALPNLLALYNFVKEKMGDFEIKHYRNIREELIKYIKEIRVRALEEISDARNKEALRDTQEIMERIYKQGKYHEFDQIYLQVNRYLLDQWKKKLEREQSDNSFVMTLDVLIKKVDETLKKMEADSNQKLPKVES